MADTPQPNCNGKVPKTLWECIYAVAALLVKQPNGVVILLFVAGICGYTWIFAIPDAQDRRDTMRQLRETMNTLAVAAASQSENDKSLAVNQMQALKNHERLIQTQAEVVGNQQLIIKLLAEAFGLKVPPPKPDHS